MNHLFLFLPALLLALVLALPGTAHTPTPTAQKTPAGQKSAPENANFQIAYYWYTYPADTYHDHTSLSVEELEWWFLLGGIYVDTNPAGGTLILRGYLTNAYPHTSFASEYLYEH